MNKIRTISIVVVIALIALALWAAGPPPGTFLVPSFFTTNAAKIYGTNGVGVSSNAPIGTYLIDGSSLSNSIAGVLSNKVDELNGVATNLTQYGLTTVHANTTNDGWYVHAGYWTNLETWYWNEPIGTPNLYINQNGTLSWNVSGANPSYLQADGSITIANGTTASIFADGSAAFGANFLQIGPDGDLDSIKGVVYSWPAANAAGTLINDGSGTLSWSSSQLTGYGVIFGATNIGSTIGRGSNFVLIVESNLTMFATNYPADGGTNVVKVNTAQPITTTAQPTLAGLTDTGNLAVQGTTTNTGAINSAGVETNWNDVYMRALVTIGDNANSFNFGADTALAQTNNTGGTRWASFAPNFGRRRCGFFINNFSGSVSIFGENSTTTGTVSYETPQTNSWWTVVYTTAASPNADAGWNHNTTASWFPGGDICYDWVGRISAVGTNQIRVWMGLTDTTLANMNGTDSPTTRNVAMVRYSQSASDANWQFVTCNASACTVTPSNTAVSTNRTSFRMVEDIVNGRWVLYINGVSAATNSANLPVASMGSNFSIRSLNGTAYAIRHSSGFVSVGGGKGNPAGDFP